MTPETADHIKWDARGSVVVQRDCTKRQEHVGIDGHREVSFQFQFDLVTVDWGAYLRMLRMLACVVLAIESMSSARENSLSPCIPSSIKRAMISSSVREEGVVDEGILMVRCWRSGMMKVCEMDTRLLRKKGRTAASRRSERLSKVSVDFAFLSFW